MKKNIRRFFALMLALVMTFGIAEPLLATAIEIAHEEENIEGLPELEVSEELNFIDNSQALLEVDKMKNVVKEVEDILENMEEENVGVKRNKAMLEEQAGPEKFQKTVEEVQMHVEEAPKGVAAGFTDIYDLTTVPDRLILFIKLCDAIRFATTQLRYKVDAAHVKIGVWIAEGLVHVASPWSTTQFLAAYGDGLEALKQELIGYPEMSLNDTANLYVRSDLDAKLHKARFLKYNELSNKSTEVIRELDKEIARITGERLRPQATVAEIYQLSDELDQAVITAQNSEDYAAEKSEIQDLKDLLRQARRARRAGDKRNELGLAIDAATRELRQIKPSKLKVNGYIMTFNSLLFY